MSATRNKWRTMMANSNRTWMTWVVVLVGGAGLGIGALALVSSLGVWFGAWDFRRGFALLRFANTGAWWIAAAGAVVVAMVVARRRKSGAGGGRGLIALSLAGTLSAALAYYVPQSFGPPAGVVIPPIHDVSTDTVDPPQYVAVLPLRADAPNTTVYGGSPNMTPERLAELQTEAYPDVRTLTLHMTPAQAFERAITAVRTLGWEVVAAVPGEGRIEATDTTFWFRFKDDIVIRIRESAEGAIVDARSLSRVGGGDVGTNARRLRAFLAEMRDE
jgi:uncharacterized protein (DUF1499 family)